MLLSDPVCLCLCVCASSNVSACGSSIFFLKSINHYCLFMPPLSPWLLHHDKLVGNVPTTCASPKRTPYPSSCLYVMRAACPISLYLKFPCSNGAAKIQSNILFSQSPSDSERNLTKSVLIACRLIIYRTV